MFGTIEKSAVQRRPGDQLSTLRIDTAFLSLQANAGTAL
jgi:hypothetical protein